MKEKILNIIAIILFLIGIFLTAIWYDGKLVLIMFIFSWANNLMLMNNKIN